MYTQIYVFVPLTFSNGASGYNGVRPFYITNALVGIATASLGMGWFQRTTWRSMMTIGHAAMCCCFAIAALLFDHGWGAGASLVILIAVAVVFTFGESLILPASNIALADLTTAILRQDRRTLIGIPIVALILWWMTQRRVRERFS